tara:strand:- start:132 stop:566 length:435 start_codon:yes stop_codon:yes gene_type:complete
MLSQAIKHAAIGHLEQTDKSGQPYILHCLHVMNTVKSNESEVKQIAVLHDYMEDCNVTPQELSELGFSDRVVEGICCLTHQEGVSYENYINIICTNRDAMLVKLADLRHNSDITRLKGVTGKDLQRMAKYHKSYIKIKSRLKAL